MSNPLDEPMNDPAQDSSHVGSRPAGEALPEPDAAGRIFVPADVIARSRPMGHSVPITRAKRKLERDHPLRQAAAIFLIGLAPLAALVLIYFAIAVSTGRHLSCYSTGSGKFVSLSCHWN